MSKQMHGWLMQVMPWQNIRLLQVCGKGGHNAGFVGAAYIGKFMALAMSSLLEFPVLSLVWLFMLLLDLIKLKQSICDASSVACTDSSCGVWIMQIAPTSHAIW